jgi:hypothetical protein
MTEAAATSLRIQEVGELSCEQTLRALENSLRSFEAMLTGRLISLGAFEISLGVYFCI